MMFEILYYASVVICFTTAAIVAVSTFKFFIGNLKESSEKKMGSCDEQIVNE